MWRLEYIYEINKLGGGIFFGGGWDFSTSVSVGSPFIREMRVAITLILESTHGKKEEKIKAGTHCTQL